MLAFFCVILGVLSLVAIVVAVTNSNSPKNIFIGHLTNKQFKILTDIIFSANPTVDYYRVTSPNYVVWIANDYYGFSINNVKDFSLYQKYYFFKKLNNYVLNKALLSKAGQILYTKELK